MKQNESHKVKPHREKQCIGCDTMFIPDSPARANCEECRKGVRQQSKTSIVRCTRCQARYETTDKRVKLCPLCIDVTPAQCALEFLRGAPDVPRCFHNLVNMDLEDAEEFVVQPVLRGEQSKVVVNDRPGGGYEGLAHAVFRRAVLDINEHLSEADGKKETRETHRKITKDRLQAAVDISTSVKQVAEILEVGAHSVRRACEREGVCLPFTRKYKRKAVA